MERIIEGGHGGKQELTGRGGGVTHPHIMEGDIDVQTECVGTKQNRKWLWWPQEVLSARMRPNKRWGKHTDEIVALGWQT